MAIRAVKELKNERAPLLEKQTTDYDTHVSNSLDVLDLNFDEIFVSVEDLDDSDIDDQGNLILERFVDDELLKKEGIPLTCDEIVNIFRSRANKNHRENLKVG